MPGDKVIPDSLRDLADKLRREGPEGRALPAGIQLERFFEWLKGELLSHGGFTDDLLAKARVILDIILGDADESTRRETMATVERVMKGDLRLTVLAERLVSQTQDVVGGAVKTAKELNSTYGVYENIQKMDRISDKMEHVADRLELWANAALSKYHRASYAAAFGAVTSVAVDAVLLFYRCVSVRRLPSKKEARLTLANAGINAAIAGGASVFPPTSRHYIWFSLAWTFGRLAYAHALRDESQPKA